MAVNISSLWSNKKFLTLTYGSKLLYLYLVTNPCINIVGVISLHIDLVALQLNFSVDDIRAYTRDLVNAGFVAVRKYDSDLFFVVKKHFDSIPKAESTITRINKELKLLPKDLVEFLSSMGIHPSVKSIVFKEPTVQEVSEYCLSKGYEIDAPVFISYYENKALAFDKPGLWMDSKGKQVKDWKAKLRSVWFKKENKRKVLEGTPQGYETFHVVFQGKRVFPESWKNGKPHSVNFVVMKALHKAYENELINK